MLSHDRRQGTQQARAVCAIHMLSADVFPNDAPARSAINVERCLHCSCSSDEYLAQLSSALDEADKLGSPDLVIHNAGTDILVKDPLGQMQVSSEAVIKRDMVVWKRFRGRGVPVCMLLSGGYAKQCAAVIAESLAAILKFETQQPQKK
jgi:acetoin utilization deacetylase AcuC-like enzyme